MDKTKCFLTIANDDNTTYCILQDEEGNVIQRSFIANSSVAKEVLTMLYLSNCIGIDKVIYLGKTVKTLDGRQLLKRMRKLKDDA